MQLSVRHALATAAICALSALLWHGWPKSWSGSTSESSVKLLGGGEPPSQARRPTTQGDRGPSASSSVAAALKPAPSAPSTGQASPRKMANARLRQMARSQSPLADAARLWQSGGPQGWRDASSIWSMCFDGAMAAYQAKRDLVRGDANDYARSEAYGSMLAKCGHNSQMSMLWMPHEQDKQGQDHLRVDTEFAESRTAETIEKSLLAIFQKGGVPYDSSAARHLFDISRSSIASTLPREERRRIADTALMHARVLAFGSPSSKDDLLMQVSCLKLDICQMSQFEAVRQKDPKGYDRIVRYMSWAYGAVEGAAPAASRPRP